VTRRHSAVPTLVLAFLCFSSPLLAQRADRATISGVVTDNQGAAVPGATVTIKNEGTGVETVLTTNEAGLYTSPPLVLGTYSVTVDLTAGEETVFRVVASAGSSQAQLVVFVAVNLGSVVVAPFFQPNSSAAARTLNIQVAAFLEHEFETWDLLREELPIARTGGANHLELLEATFDLNGAGKFVDDLGYDDQAWWGLVWVRAFDVTGERRYLDAARFVFQDMTTAWTTSPCGGGSPASCAAHPPNAPPTGSWRRSPIPASR